MISVLLVDDEPALLDITQIFLEKEGKMSVTLSESDKGCTCPPWREVV